MSSADRDRGQRNRGTVSSSQAVVEAERQQQSNGKFMVCRIVLAGQPIHISPTNLACIRLILRLACDTPALRIQLAYVTLRSTLPIVDCDISFLRWTVTPPLPR